MSARDTISLPHLRDRVRSLLTDADAPLRQGAFDSPLRDERVAALLGISLGVLFTICFATGLYSHLHQHPLSWLPVPARPAGLYRFTQGLHVAAGIASLPVLLAKLWVVWPRFVSYPPVKSVSQLIERIGIFPLVGGGIFMVFSGVANIAQWYPWRFAFPAAHYSMAWVTMGALLAHMGAKWPIARRSFARRSFARPPKERVLGAEATGAGAGVGAGVGAAETAGAAGGLSRSGFLGAVASAAGVLTLATLGQTFRPLQRFALLAPRDPSIGPQGRPVNRSATNAGVVQAAGSADYRLIVEGRVDRPLSLGLAELLALPSHEAILPIACVEGWSYSARWRGIRVRDLLVMAGAANLATAHVESLEANSPYRISQLDHAQVVDRDTLLATHLDGDRLTLDHGYPVRLIGPGRPGVNQTKWVTRLVVS